MVWWDYVVQSDHLRSSSLHGMLGLRRACVLVFEARPFTRMCSARVYSYLMRACLLVFEARLFTRI